MTPKGNNILFKPFASPEFSENGLLIPETARQPNNKGTIVKVGEGTKKQPMRLKEGMVGYRVKNWGEPIIIDNEIYYLMDERAIIAVE